MGQPQELRHAAAQAFIESLGQLQQSLESAPEQPKPSAPSSFRSRPLAPAAAPAVPFDLDSLEDAIADIEQFMGKLQS